MQNFRFSMERGHPSEIHRNVAPVVLADHHIQTLYLRRNQAMEMALGESSSAHQNHFHGSVPPHLFATGTPINGRENGLRQDMGNTHEWLQYNMAESQVASTSQNSVAPLPLAHRQSPFASSFRNESSRFYAAHSPLRQAPEFIPNSFSQFAGEGGRNWREASLSALGPGYNDNYHTLNPEITDSRQNGAHFADDRTIPLQNPLGRFSEESASYSTTHGGTIEGALGFQQSPGETPAPLSVAPTLQQASTMGHNGLATIIHQEPTPAENSQQLKRKRAYEDDDIGDRPVRKQVIKTFECTVPGCGWWFSRRPDLRRHNSTVHSDAKPFVCDFPGCLASFSRKDALQRHGTGHTARREEDI